MNISITNACNRRCGYCFQKDWYLSRKANKFDDDSVLEMSIEDFSRLCRWSPGVGTIKLLGGEPLLYSHPEPLMEAARKNGKEVVFISNISVGEDQFDRWFQWFDVPLQDSSEDCKDNRFHGRRLVRSFLINTDFPKSQEEIFKRNLTRLCTTNLDLGFSTTLLPGPVEIEKARTRIKELADIYRNIRGTIEGFRIRLAPFCPNPTNSTYFHIYDFTDDIISFINSLRSTGIVQYGFDCPVNLCELRHDFIDACRNMGIQIKIRQCGPETGFPFDVLADNSVIWCSSANFLRLNDWRDYESYQDAKRALSERYYDWWRKHGFAAKCRACDKNNPGFCHGLCIAKTKSLGTVPIVPAVQL